MIEEHWCEDCDQEIGFESHYHCGRCHHPKPTSMMGHYQMFNDGTFGLICEPENLGKEYGSLTVTEEDIWHDD